MEQAIDYLELSEILESCGSSWNASQVHGLLCSRLAVAGGDGATRWFAQVLEETDPDHALRAACEAMLDSLCALTWKQLVERQSELTLLLPVDQDSTSLRAQAMGQWCEGYLHGLVSEKHSEDLKTRLAADPLVDIIKDMLQITRATATEDEDGEAEESALTELVEYLRVATQLTYEELADFRAPNGESVEDNSDTLH